MTWPSRELELPKATYRISRALTSDAPEAGTLYRALASGGFVYLGLLPEDAAAVRSAEAAQIQALSRKGAFLPARQVIWYGAQSAFLFAGLRPVPFAQAASGPARSAEWAVNEVTRLAEAVDRFQAKLDSAAWLRPGRVVALEPDGHLALVPPMRLDRDPAARQEDVHQLALLAAHLLTGQRQTPESLAAATLGLTEPVRSVLAAACRDEYATAGELAHALAAAVRLAPPASVAAALPAKMLAEPEEQEVGPSPGISRRWLIPLVAIALLAVLGVVAAVVWRNAASTGPVGPTESEPTATPLIATATPTGPTLTPSRTATPTRTVTLTPPPSATKTATYTMTPSPTRSPTATPTPTPVPLAVVKSDANVRSGPGTAYERMIAAGGGSQLRVFGRDPSCEWWWVELPGGQRGWVSVALLESSAAPCQPLPTGVPTLPPTPTVTPTSTATPTLTPSLTPTVTPTFTASLTPTVTNTPRPTATRTLTPRPTAVVVPTPNNPAPPTATGSAWCPHPDSCIVDPRNDETITGVTTVRGKATCPNFLRYKVEYLPEGGTNWGVLRERYQPVQERDGALMEWWTGTVPPGAYLLRLTVVDKTGNYLPQAIIRVVVIR